MTQEAKNTRTDFENFLVQKLPVGGNAAAYAKSLDSKIKKFYREKMNRDFGSVYEFGNEDDVITIRNDIAANPSMVYQRGRNGDPRLEGLGWYIEFLKTPRPITVTDRATGRVIKRIRRASEDKEGKHIKRETVVIQRNREARRRCIEHFGCKCAACGLDMSDKYGELGKGVIEVHHLNPIHLFDDTHKVDYLTDLIPLCPNCHTMIHKLDDPGDIEGLKLLLKDWRDTQCCNPR